MANELDNAFFSLFIFIPFIIIDFKSTTIEWDCATTKPRSQNEYIASGNLPETSLQISELIPTDTMP